MLLILANLGFAGGEASSGVSWSGMYKKVYAVSTSGRTRWIDYIPVQYVSISSDLVGRWDYGGGLPVETIGSVSGLTEWVDYIPIVVEGTTPYTYDDSGYLAIVEVVPS